MIVFDSSSKIGNKFRKRRTKEMSKQKTGHSAVVNREVTIEEIEDILQNQKNIITTNDRSSGNDAFEVALEGSKAYLEAQGYLEDKGE